MRIITSTQFDLDELVNDVNVKLNGLDYAAAMIFMSSDLDCHAVLNGISLKQPNIGCTFLECKSGMGTQLISLAIILIPEKYNPTTGLLINFSLGSSGLIAFSCNDTQLVHYCTQYSFAGGIAADSWSFDRAKVFLNGDVMHSSTVAIQLDGDIESTGECGWEPITGHVSYVSKVIENKVFEIDGKPAINYYLNYTASPDAFPAYPLKLIDSGAFRAPLGYSLEEGAITFAASIPVGARVQLTSTRRNLVLSATEAAVCRNKNLHMAELCIMVSCAARNLILGNSTSQEYELLSERNQNGFVIYLYGEFLPSKNGTALQHQHAIVTSFKGV